MSQAVAILLFHVFGSGLCEDNKDELHQDYVGQNKEERAEHNRVCSRTAYTLSASPCLHSLEARY